MEIEYALKHLRISFTVACDNSINVKKNTRTFISAKRNFKKQEFDNMMIVAIEQPLMDMVEDSTDTMKVDIYHDLKNPKCRFFIKDNY